jgi:hypothetical protein
MHMTLLQLHKKSSHHSSPPINTKFTRTEQQHPAQQIRTKRSKDLIKKSITAAIIQRQTRDEIALAAAAAAAAAGQRKKKEP